MAESMKQVALPDGNEQSASVQGNEGTPLLFIQVQPQRSTSTAAPVTRMVRKHVMSNAARNRLRESSEEVTHSSTEKEPGDMQKQLNRFRLKMEHPRGQKLRYLAAKPTLCIAPLRSTTSVPLLANQSYLLEHMPVQDPTSTYRRDPFVVYPVEADDQVQSLFAFYLNDLNDKSLSQNPNRDFIPIALSNSGCFHVLLATLLQVQTFQGRPGGACFWHHRGAAIAALNHELTHQHAKIDDTMIITVGMLLYVETRVPSLRSQTASLHIAALIKFIELRKGIIKLELYCMLLRLAVWCSINPPLSRPPLVAQTNQPNFDFELVLPCSAINFTPFPKSIFDDIKLLVRLRAEFGCDETSDKKDRERNKMYQTIVTQGLERASASLSTSPTTSMKESNVVRCIQLGKLLFLYTICPSMSISGIYYQSIAAALRACLEAGCGGSEFVRWSPEILCWLLVNGAITKQGENLQMWYLRRLTEFIRTQGMVTFSQIEALLCKVAWSEDQFGPACRSIWMRALAA